MSKGLWLGGTASKEDKGTGRSSKVSWPSNTAVGEFLADPKSSFL